jgi:hypothetical protein
MAATPIQLGISFFSPVHFLTKHWQGSGNGSPNAL